MLKKKSEPKGMRKIVISANTSWYIYNFRKNTILALLKKGYHVHVVCPEDDYSKKITSLGADFSHINIDQGGANPLRDIKTFFCFIFLLFRIKPCILLNFTPKNNIYGTLAAKILGVKVVNNIAGLGTLFVQETAMSKVARALYKISQRYADMVFFQNENDRCLFLDKKIVSKEKTMRVPGSGVDLSRFELIFPPDDGVIRFLLIARMLYEKGVSYYVEAARELKQRYGTSVEFRLLGFLDANNPSAISHEQMKQWVNEGVIDYLGVSDNVEEEISKVDCIVLPSFYREGVPKSLLEAGAMGKPIIASDNVGCRETVLDGVNGFLCEVKSTSSLVSKMDMIISMTHDERCEMGVRSRDKMASEFDESIVINKYLDVIAILANK